MYVTKEITQVSDNEISHFTSTTESRGKERLKRWVFRRLTENSQRWRCRRDVERFRY